MSCLAYIFLHTIKNRLLDIFKKPVKLIMYLLLFALIIFFILAPMFDRTPIAPEEYADIAWLKAGIFAFLLFISIASLINGLKSGDVIYNMSDVNFLFVSPLNPRAILVYGAVRMMWTTLLMGFFILFQSSTLSLFGIGLWGLPVVLLGYILCACLMQLMSLVIYNLTNGRPQRKMVVRVVAVAVFVPMAVYFIYQFAVRLDLSAAIFTLMRSPVSSFTPIVGWTAAGVVGFITGDILSGLLFLGLLLALGLFLVLFVLYKNPDYYEDVLVATETVFERNRALAEGNIEALAAPGKKVKVVKTGINGWGATTLFHKHLREAFRASRLGFLEAKSFLIIAIAFFVTFAVRSAATNDFWPGYSALGLLAWLMWMQTMMIGTGRGLRELFSHYIYLIPSSSFSKIVWSNIELLMRTIVECTIAFVVAGVMLGLNPLLVVTLIVVYTFFSLFLIAINIAALRWSGTVLNAGLLFVYYFLAIVLLMLPGVIIAALIIFRFGGNLGLVLGLLALTVWEAILSVVCFALAQGLLHKCDIPVVKTGG
jgi:hypothetical protein